MLKKELNEKLKTLGLDVDKLVTAIKAPGEIDYEVPEGILMSESVLVQRDATMKEEGIKEGKLLGFKEGKDAGLDIYGKAIAKKFNLDPTLIKISDPDKISEAIHSSSARGDEGLKEQIKFLQSDKDKLTLERENLRKEKEEALFNSSLITNMPITRSSDIMNDEEYLLAIKTALKFENIDGALVVKRNNEIMRHSVSKAPLPLKEAITEYFKDRKWLKAEQSTQGGRGDGDKLPIPGGIRTYSAFEKKWKEDNPDKNIGTSEFQTALLAAKKAATDFDINA
jgi:hypothetical protein